MAESNTSAPRPQKAGWLTRLFGFDGSKMKVSTEILAGITTFLAMSYILAVNPSILGDTGMDKNALFSATAVSASRCVSCGGTRTIWKPRRRMRLSD